MEVRRINDDIVIAVDEIDGDEGLTARERERTTVTRMLRLIAGNVGLPVDEEGNVPLSHNEAGRPFINGINISISHTVSKTGGWAAIMLSGNHNVGIDIEYRSERIMKIASRFLRADEYPQSVVGHLVNWCAKEAVYKLRSDENLTYQQMRVSDDATHVDDLKNGKVFPVYSFINDDFVLVYSYSDEE